MSTTPRSSTYSNPDNNASTLRPRNARLISYLEDNISSADATTNAVSTSTSTSRGVSPGAQPHSRSTVRASFGTQERASSVEGARRPSNGLWESWSQIQGIASTILRNDAPANMAGKADKGLKSPLWMKQDRTYSTSTSAPKWGPKAPSKKGAEPGSIEERQALVQAKKREALLLAASADGRDSLGKFKRKGSDASLRFDASTSDVTDHALVYRHKVLPNDTMAGVAIKYSCQPESFRKVNRLWPNDRIQIRTHVLLPVEACAIRGRKLEDHEARRQLGKAQHLDKQDLNEQKDTDPSESAVSPPAMVETTPEQISMPTSEDDAESYAHDSWISLPNFEQPVQILRIPRRTLGYFPPARRKSNHHLSVATASADSSPRTSFDTLRHPPTHAAQQAQLQQQYQRTQQTPLNPNLSPGRRPDLISRQRSASSSTSRSLTSATATNHKNAKQAAFFRALQGPGGVGNLHGLRSESSRPGPADDPLNQRFPNLVPYIAPPSGVDALLSEPSDFPTTSLSALSSRSVSASFTASVPRASMDSLRSTRSGRSNSNSSAFGNVGAAGVVGDWVKKIATSAGRPGMSRTNSDRTIGPGAGVGIGGDTGLGDLIELENSTELLELSEGIPGILHIPQSSQRGRRRRENECESNSSGRDIGGDDDDSDGEETPRLKTTMTFDGTGTGTSGATRGGNDGGGVQVSEETEELLNERFPVRGRVTRAYIGD